MEPKIISYYYYDRKDDKHGPFKPNIMQNFHNEGQRIDESKTIEIICNISTKTTVNFTTTLGELCSVYGRENDIFPTKRWQLNALLNKPQNDDSSEQNVPTAGLSRVVKVENDEFREVGAITATNQIPNGGFNTRNLQNPDFEARSPNLNHQNPFRPEYAALDYNNGRSGSEASYPTIEKAQSTSDQGERLLPSYARPGALGVKDEAYIPFSTGTKANNINENRDCSKMMEYGKSLGEAFIGMSKAERNKLLGKFEQFRLPTNCHLCVANLRKSTDVVSHFLSRNHIAKIYKSGNVLSYEKDYLRFDTLLRSVKRENDAKKTEKGENRLSFINTVNGGCNEASRIQQQDNSRSRSNRISALRHRSRSNGIELRRKMTEKAYIPYCTGMKSYENRDIASDCKTMTEFGKSLLDAFIGMNYRERVQFLQKFDKFELPKRCHLCNAPLKNNNDAFSHFTSRKHIDHIYESGNILSYEEDYLALEKLVESVKRGAVKRTNLAKRLEHENRRHMSCFDDRSHLARF